LPSDSLILGFDTSAAHCAAVLLSGDVVLAARHEDMAKGQAERLMPLLEEVLAEGGVDWSDLVALGVGIGPGNFTGVRISVSAARGLALGLGIPAVGVSLLDALAFGSNGPVLACLDARRGAAYLQRHGYGDPAPFLASLDALPDLAAPGLVCVGTIADQVADLIGARHVPAVYAPASAIARIAVRRAVRPDERPAPLYLRSADAAPPRDVPPVILP